MITTARYRPPARAPCGTLAAWRLRTLRPDELAGAYAFLERAFGNVVHEEDLGVELGVVDADRTYGAFDGPDLVATAGSFDLSLAVPGAVLPVAGVTWVAVRPTHRRRGLLTSSCPGSSSDLHDAGTAVAALWASEAGIYGRFGYGPATWHHAVTVPRGAALRGPVPDGEVQLVEPGAGLLRPVYDAVAARTPGFPARDDAWWAYRLHDPDRRRDGGTELQCLRTDGGYALFGVVGRWESGLPTGTVVVRELLALDAGAEARLWRHLLDTDLTSAVQAWAVAPDSPLLLDLLAEPRVAGARVRDGLHVRLVDLSAALAGRRYAATSTWCSRCRTPRARGTAGRWRLTGDRSGATCVADDGRRGPGRGTGRPRCRLPRRDAAARRGGSSGAHGRGAGRRVHRVRADRCRAVVPAGVLGGLADRAPEQVAPDHLLAVRTSVPQRRQGSPCRRYT